MDFHTWNTFADIWIPRQHRIHWEVVVFFFFLKIKCSTITSLDLMEFRAQILINWNLNSMGLNCIWKLWNPDVLWRARSGLCTHLFVTTFKRRWPAAWENPLVGLQREHNVPAQKDSGLACHSIWYKCFDQPGKRTVFFSPTLSPGTTGYI